MLIWKEPINNAKKNIDTNKFDSKQVEEYKRRLDEIDRTNMNHVRDQIASIGREMESQRNKTKDFADSLGKIGDSLNEAGDALIKAFALPTAGLVASTKTMMDFTAEMSNVEAISGVTKQEMQLLENEAKLMGRTTVKSAKESAEALKYMGMA